MLTGTTPAGAVLTLRRTGNAPTADGTTAPRSTTTSPGAFEWDVNPSAAWTLDRARPVGTVLQSVPVAVDLSGRSASWTG